MRGKLREITATAGGKAIHPVLGLPGGVARRIRPEERCRFQRIAAEALDFARFTLNLFEHIVLNDRAYIDLILSDPFTHATHFTWAWWTYRTW